MPLGGVRDRVASAPLQGFHASLDSITDALRLLNRSVTNARPIRRVSQIDGSWMSQDTRRGAKSRIVRA